MSAGVWNITIVGWLKVEEFEEETQKVTHKKRDSPLLKARFALGLIECSCPPSK